MAKARTIATGIFVRRIEPPETILTSSPDFMEKLWRRINATKPYQVQLSEMRQAAIAILREYGVAVSDDGQHDITPDSKVREECHDAVEILNSLDEIATLPAEQSRAVILGFKLGKRTLMLNIRQAGYEPLADQGKRHIKGSKKGTARLKAKTSDRRQKTIKEYLRQKVGKVSHTEAMKRTAAALEIDFTTVREHLKSVGITAKIGTKPRAGTSRATKK